MWCIPPKEDAAFVCQMEQVLEVYKRPYDPKRPVVCMDEQPKQLIAETRLPCPEATGQPARVDYEYVRRGVCVVWMFVEALAGWRDVAPPPTSARPQNATTCHGCPSRQSLVARRFRCAAPRPITVCAHSTAGPSSCWHGAILSSRSRMRGCAAHGCPGIYRTARCIGRRDRRQHGHCSRWPASRL
jgi:hypothetical protein